MRLYEIQPADHKGDFEVREREVTDAKFMVMPGYTTIFLTISLPDGQPHAVELEFTLDEVRAMRASLDEIIETIDAASAS